MILIQYEERETFPIYMKLDTFLANLSSHLEMATKKEPQVHFVLLPLMSPGHFIPMLDLAKLLANQNVRVTIVTVPVIASKFTPHLARSPPSLSLLTLPFPVAQAGLPEGCESIDLIPSRDLLMPFFKAIYMLQEPFEQLFEKLEPSPSCILSDMYIAWVAESAQKFDVPRVIFDGMSCFTTLTQHNLYATKAYESVEDSGFFVLPGLPDRVEMCRAHLPIQFTSSSTKESEAFTDRVRDASVQAYGVVINSFDELESKYVDELKKVRNGKVWCIGPLSLCNKENADKVERGNKAAIGQRECLEWLDGKETGSVVYACLGSLCRLTLPQLVELGLGLETSKRPFVWVVRGGDNAKEIQEWIDEDGFEERTKGRGLIIRGWAPQVLILSHPSVGSFLTHCGWNSTLEGICAGIPLITWPMFTDQFLNEKLVVEVLKTGVGVGNKQVVNVYEEDKFGVLMKREKVVEAVERAMDEGVEGQERRERAKALGEKAEKAMGEGGSSQLNLTLLIEDILQFVWHK